MFSPVTGLLVLLLTAVVWQGVDVTVFFYNPNIQPRKVGSQSRPRRSQRP
jgi:predicted adenine nucleotide alpha hydrolase (AANH) superfamily ATPase